MIRVKASCLSFDKDKCYYNNKLFNGISFEIVDGVVEKKIKFLKGEPNGDYTNDYFLYNEPLAHLNVDFLQFDDESYLGEPVKYNREYFTGVAYEFQGEFCCRETLYIDGFLNSDIEYDISGKLNYLEVSNKNYSAICSWYENGKSAKISLFKKGEFRTKIEFTEDNKLKSLSINDDYFNGIIKIKDSLMFPIFENKSYFSKLVCASRLYLSGSAVDDELFNYIISNNGLSEVEEFVSHETALTESSLFKLKKLENLKRVNITTSSDELLSCLGELKEYCPYLVIKFNNKLYTE